MASPNTTEDYLCDTTETIISHIEPLNVTKNYKAINSMDIVFMTVGAIGVIDNGLVLIVIQSNKMMRSNITNLLLINQSCIDLLTSLLLIINYTAQFYITSEALSGPYGDILCQLWLNQVFIWSLFIASSYNLIAITIERYIEIVHPFVHKKYFNRTKAYIGMGLAWFIGFFYKPSFFIPSSFVIKSIPICILTASRFLGVFAFFVEYALPVTVIIYCYTQMAMSLKMRVGPDTGINTQMSVCQRQRQHKMTKIKKNILKTLFIVASCYFICWTGNQVLFLLYNLGAVINFFTVFYHITVTLCFLNTCINPFIYIVRYKQFQHALKRLLCGKQ